MSFFGRIGQDITHPFGLGNPQPQQRIQPAQPIRTPAPQQQVQQRPIASTAPRPMQVPHMNPFQRVGNAFHNDVVSPIARDVVQPTAHAGGNVQHAAGNTVNALSTHSLNNVANSNFNPTHLVENNVIAPAAHVAGYFGRTDIINPARQLMAQASHNQVAQQNAMRDQRNTMGPTPGQAAKRLIGNTAQLGLSLVPGEGAAVDKLGATAGSKIAGLADNKLASIGGKVAQKGIQYAGKGVIGGANGYAFGAGQTLAQNPSASLKQVNQAGMANAKIGAALGVGIPAIHDAAPVVAKTAQTANSMAHNYGLKPPTNLTPAELAASSKVINGNPMELTSQDTKLFHQAQIKLVPADQVGTAHGMNAASDALNAHAAYNNAVAQRAQTVQAIKQNLLHPTPLNEGGYIAGPQAFGFKAAKANGKVFEGVDGKPRFEVGDQGAKLKQLPTNPTNGISHHTGKLSDVLDHPLLYTQYPELRNTDVSITIDPKHTGAENGSYAPLVEHNPDGTMEIKKVLNVNAPNPEAAKKTILHEIQHVIQEKEGFAKGGSVSSPDKGQLDAINQQIKEHTDLFHKATNDVNRRKQIVQSLMELEDQKNALLDAPYKDYKNLAGEAESRAVEARMNMKPGERYVNGKNTFDSSLDVPKDQLIVNHGGDGVVNGKAMSIRPDQIHRDVAGKFASKPNYFKPQTEIDQINRILDNKDTVGTGQKIGDYYRTAKGEDWNVQHMSPDEYLQRAAKAMGQDPAEWATKPMGDPAKYAQAMKNGDKFPMPWINEVAGSQEGRTRALAAKAAGQDSIPVAVAKKAAPTGAHSPKPTVMSNAVAAAKKLVDTPANDPLANLKQEALKYKSADEFVKNNYVGSPNEPYVQHNIEALQQVGIKVSKPDDLVTLYHGTKNGNKASIDKNGFNEGSYFSTSKKASEGFNMGHLYEIKVPVKDVTFVRGDQMKGSDGVIVEAHTRLKQSPDGTWRSEWNKPSKQQLHDLYNQAHAEAKPSLPSRLGIKPLDQSGKALVSEDGSVIPTIKKLVGKGNNDAALLQSEAKRISQVQGGLAGDDHFLKQRIANAKTPQQVKETADYIRMSQQRAAQAAAEEAKQPFKSGIRRELYNQALQNPGMDIDNAAVNWRSSNSTGLMSDRTLDSHVQAVKEALANTSKPQQAPVAPTPVSKLAGSSKGSIAPKLAGNNAKPTDLVPAVQPKQTSKPAKAASEAGSVALPKSTPNSAKTEPTGNDLMKHFSDMRKQYGNDAEFFDKVILNNQEAPGMIGQLSRSIAATDAREGGKNYPISAILDDHLTPVNHATEAANYKSSQLNDLKQTARQLERDTGQKGLYQNIAKGMAGMTEDQQIAHLSKGLSAARDSGAMAVAHINKQNGFKTGTTPTETKIGIESKQPSRVTPTAIAPKSTPEDIGKALGMSPKDVATAQAANLSPADKAELTPKEQMLLHSADTPLRTPEQNRALNPVKSGLQHVPQDNHDMAISQSQMVHNDVMLHGSQVLTAFDKLNKGEQSNFMRSVEKLPADASPKLKEAVSRWKAGANTVHAHSQSDVLGGNTNYLKNYALHSWDLPADFGATDHVINGGGKDFQGLNNISRIHATIADGESSGLKLNSDPKAVRKQIEGYFGGSANALRKQTLRTGMAEADAGNMEKTGHLTLGIGDTVPLSAKGMKAAKGVQWSPASTNKAVTGYRKVNRGATSVLLTHSGVHELNITSRASPGLALKGHPLAALKAAGGGVRGNFDKGYIDTIRQKALDDGTANKAAMMGTPYSTGHGLLDRQLTPIHDQVVRSVIKDLEKKNIPLTSPEARKIGKAASGMMGEVNYQLAHVSPGHSRLLGDIFLAKQFTPSKLLRVGQAVSDKGLGGHYARATIAGNALLATATIAGLGYAFKQKSDNLKDSLIRAILAPSVPTPIKDSKGNNQQVRLLGTDTSDVAKILGITMTRNTDGHLGISWNPKNLPTTSTDFLRSRLAPMLSDSVKLATNTNYAGKPLYDPNAAAGTKAIQAATTLITGHLPIAAQSLAYSKPVKAILPGSSKTILNANTPKTNSATQAALGLVGGAMATDTTTGKGLQSKQYYAAMNQASSGLNSQEKAAMQMVTGSKKNPVTGAYEVKPTSDDSRAKATALLQNPKVIDKLQAMNQKLKSEGQSVDPLWAANKDQITKYYQYQAMPPGSADKADWLNKNKSWYTPVANARNTFFNSLPKGDPNKPQSPIKYPDATPAVANLQNQYDGITDSSTKGDFIAQHPELLQQWQKQADYTNEMRVAQGYAPLKSSPQATPQLQSYMDKYNAADKSTRKAIRNSNPQAYQGMIGYYDSVDLYNINKAGALDQLQGEPDQTSKQNKAIHSLAQDIYQNPDGSYGIVPAGWMNGLSNGSGFGYGSKGKKPGSVSYGGTSKVTNDALAGLKMTKASTTVSGKKISLKSYAPKAAKVTLPKPPRVYKPRRSALI